jgi:predicted RNA-binding Zn-ribbon protein involved in translation (DUF1610 family)
MTDKTAVPVYCAACGKTIDVVEDMPSRFMVDQDFYHYGCQPGATQGTSLRPYPEQMADEDLIASVPPCPDCGGTGRFMGGRASIVMPVCQTCGGTGSAPPQAPGGEAERLRAAPQDVPSHADLCLLSRVFCQVTGPTTSQEVRINEWLKSLIARAALAGKGE